MNKELINKINYYANKSKSTGLTKEEELDQQKLRKEYMKLFRKSFKERLDNIDIEYVD